MDKNEIKKKLQEIFTSLQKGKFDAISQIVGYLNSGDPGYVSTFENAREKIISLDRYQITEILLKEFLEK